MITVQQLPLVITISGENAICLTASETFLIINGNAGDVVTYTDSITETTVTLVNNGDNIIPVIPAPDVTTTYVLLKVVSGTTGCEFALDGSHTIEVLLVNCGTFPWIGN